MSHMNSVNSRDLDLNLLRVFVVTAEAGSVTAAAERLYLTQPAVSAAMKRLSSAVGAPLFARAGRGLTLTARGELLLGRARPHLEALLAAALSPTVFDPKTSERTVRLGLADASEPWLLPALLRVLAQRAPRLRLIVLPVQFRTVGEALASGRVDMAVTVADELPAGTERSELFVGELVCLFDPRFARLGKTPSLASYLAHDHVVVSYNGDLRGIVEDALGLSRRVRLSVPSFQSVGGVIDGTALVATVPSLVARELSRTRPHLRTAPLPFSLGRAPMELLWRKAVADDDAVRFVRDEIVRISRAAVASSRRPPATPRAGARARRTARP
ncbi:MAG: LysR family transcriptional regulator [Polyangiaceae bacterium]